LVASDTKTVAKSFRINKKALRSVQEEAKRQNLSVNMLVNQLLIDYSEFGRLAHQVNSLLLSRRTFSEILSVTPEEGLATAGRNAGKTAPSTLILSKTGEDVTVKSILEYMHDLSSYANLFEYSETHENGHWTITLQHELGNKWSIFLANYLTEAFNLASAQPKITVSERSITLKL